MSAKRRKAILALGIAALTGCELVAGIHDLTYSAAGGGGAPDADDSMLGQGESGTGVPSTAESGSDGSSTTLPGTDGTPPPLDDAGDALGNTVSPTTGDASEIGDAVGLDNTDGGDAMTTDGAARDADARAVIADAKPVPVVVPIPGPDGGPLSADAGDGGRLLGELIDDMDTETTPGWIPVRSGRVGTWFTYDDGTAGGIVPPPMSDPALSIDTIAGWNGTASNLAAHMTGNGMAVYGGMGFDLNAYNNVATTYDATAYRGVVFWGRIGGEAGTYSVKFAIPDVNTSAAGGICTTDGGTSGCGDYFSKSVPLTPIWHQFVIYYSQLRQTGFGVPKGLSGLDAAHVYSCEYQVAPGAPFDVWIDDVYFILK